MMNARFVPLPPDGHARPRRSEFRAGYGSTLTLLEQELHKIAARDILIQAGFRLSMPCSKYDRYEDNLRAAADPGEMTRGEAAIWPQHAAVIVSFRSSKGQRPQEIRKDGWPYSSARPRSDRRPEGPGVRVRLRESRSVRSNTAAGHSFRLASIAGLPKETILEDPETAYHIAARKLHPDTGGSHEDFVMLSSVMALLRVPSGGPR